MSGSPALEAQLRDGSTLAIEIAEPPFDRSCDWKRLCWWPLIREEMMEGKLGRWMHAPHFIGRIDGRSQAPCATTRRRTPATLPRCSSSPPRSASGAAASARRWWGRSSVTSPRTAAGHSTCARRNPVAGHLYESHGFRYHVGDGMRFLAPGAADFDRRWFAGGAATIRDAHWGDRGPAVRLVQPSRSGLAAQGSAFGVVPGHAL